MTRRRRRYPNVNWWHTWIMDDYGQAADAWERQRQEACLDFRAERLAFAEQYPPPTLRAFLVDRKGQRPYGIVS